MNVRIGTWREKSMSDTTKRYTMERKNLNIRRMNPYNWGAEAEYRIDIFHPQPVAGGAKVSQLVNGRDARSVSVREILVLGELYPRVPLPSAPLRGSRVARRSRTVRSPLAP